MAQVGRQAFPKWCLSSVCVLSVAHCLAALMHENLELTTWLLSRSCFALVNMIKTASVVVSYKVHVDAVDRGNAT